MKIILEAYKKTGGIMENEIDFKQCCSDA